MVSLDFARAAASAPGRLLGAASVLLLLACRAPPPASVATPWGLARADTAAEAEQLAALLEELGPRVREVLPGALDRPTEVWLDDFSRDSDLADRPAVVGLTALDEGRIRIRADRLGRDADYVLVHELVHALLGPSWDPLPAVLKEGLCDAIACRLVPESAPRVRAVRFFDAGFAWADMALQLHYFEPAQRARTELDIPVAAEHGTDPWQALVLPGGGIHLHDVFTDENALYGFGLLLTERIVERIGLEGLHALCLRAAEEGHEVVPVAWVLAAAGLDRSPDAWRTALLQRMAEPLVASQCTYLAGQLAAFVVGTFRYRFPGLDGDAFLDVTMPTVGWKGGAVRVAVTTVEPLEDAIIEHWERVRPTALHPGEGGWITDRDGLHLTSVLQPTAGEPWLTISRLAFAGEEPAEADVSALLRAGHPAQVEAYLQIGRDEAGPFLRSALPGGFDSLRVELEGRVVADLASATNVSVHTDEQGWTTVVVRLPATLDLADLALYHPDANLLVTQRASTPSPWSEQHFPMRLSYLRPLP